MSNELLDVTISVDKTTIAPKVDLIIPKDFSQYPSGLTVTEKADIQAAMKKSVEDALQELNYIAASKAVNRTDTGAINDLTVAGEGQVEISDEFLLFSGVLAGDIPAKRLELMARIKDKLLKININGKDLFPPSTGVDPVLVERIPTVLANVPGPKDYFPEAMEAQSKGWYFNELDTVLLDRNTSHPLIDYLGTNPPTQTDVDQITDKYLKALAKSGIGDFTPGALFRNFTTTTDRKNAVDNFDKMMVKSMAAIYIILNEACTNTSMNNNPVEQDVKDFMRYLVGSFVNARNNFLGPLASDYIGINEEVSKDLDTIAASNPNLTGIIELTRQLNRTNNERLFIIDLNNAITGILARVRSGTLDLSVDADYASLLTSLKSITAQSNKNLFGQMSKSQESPYEVGMAGKILIAPDYMAGINFNPAEFQEVIVFVVNGIVLDGASEVNMQRYKDLLDAVTLPTNEKIFKAERGTIEYLVRSALIERTLTVLVDDYALGGSRRFPIGESPFDDPFESENLFADIGEHADEDHFNSIQSMIRVLRKESLKPDPNYCKVLYIELKDKINRQKDIHIARLKAKPNLDDHDTFVLNGINEVLIMIHNAEDGLPALGFDTYKDEFEDSKGDDKGGFGFLERKLREFKEDYEQLAEEDLNDKERDMQAARKAFESRLRSAPVTKEILEQKKNDSIQAYERSRQRLNTLRENMEMAMIAVRNMNRVAVGLDRSQSKLDGWKKRRDRLIKLRRDLVVAEEYLPTALGTAATSLIAGQILPIVGHAVPPVASILLESNSGNSFESRRNRILRASNKVRDQRLLVIENEYNQRANLLIGSRENMYKIRSNLILLCRFMDNIDRSRPYAERLAEMDRIWAQVSSGMGMKDAKSAETTYTGIVSDMKKASLDLRKLAKDNALYGKKPYRAAYYEERKKERERWQKLALGGSSRIANKVQGMPLLGNLFKTLQPLFT